MSDDDTGADFKLLREASQARRQANLKKSTAILQESGVAYTTANGGVHCIIRHEGRVFDFWPSTGKWRERMDGIAGGSFVMTNSCKRDGRGVFELLRELKVLQV